MQPWNQSSWDVCRFPAFVKFWSGSSTYFFKMKVEKEHNKRADHISSVRNRLRDFELLHVGENCTKIHKVNNFQWLKSYLFITSNIFMRVPWGREVPDNPHPPGNKSIKICCGACELHLPSWNYVPNFWLQKNVVLSVHIHELCSYALFEELLILKFKLHNYIYQYKTRSTNMNTYISLTQTQLQ